MEQEGEKRREQKRQRVQQQQPQFPQQQQQRQKCPRCDSINTKFCYFNNYSLSQPRHYCKTCKRYWTQGGTFRNIPVGGASRKVNKRSKTISSSNLLTQQPQQNLLRPSPSAPLAPIVHSSTTPYYYNNNNNLGSGSGFYNFSFRSMMNTSSQPNNFSQYLKLGGGDVNDVAGSCSSNSPSLVSGFNAAYSSRPPRFQQQRLVATNMASGSGAGAVSHSAGYYRPQSLINNNNIVSTSTTTNHRASDASFWNAATINNVSGNSDQNNVKRGSSSSSPNHHWLHRPGFGPSP